MTSNPSTTDLEQRIRQLEDIEAIRALKAKYSMHADEKYTDDHQLRSEEEREAIAGEQASVFTEDAIWDGGAQFGVLRGKKAIHASLRSIGWKFAMHYFVNPVIEVNGDRATGRWMLWEVATLAASDKAVFLAAVTEDEYVRTSEGWRIAKVTLRMKFMTPFDRPWNVDRNGPFRQ